MTEALTNWAGNVRYSARQLHRPHSIAELQSLVASSPRLRALGTRHSFSRIADTTGDLVSVEALDPHFEFHQRAQTITIPAGAGYAAVTTALVGHGRALANLASLPHISVAGAVATATHGSGNGNQCLAGSVVGVEFVRADGEIVRATAEDADFPGLVVSLGAHGIVTRLTLKTRAAFDLRQRVWQDAPLETVLERFDDIMDSAYSVSLFVDPQRRNVVDQIWTKSDADAAAPDATAWDAVPASEPRNPIAGQDARAATAQLGERRPWFDVLPHFRPNFTPSSGSEQQSEYLVARKHGPAALAAVCRLDLREAMQVMEIRTVAADDMWLSPASGRDSVALHFTWHNDDAVVHGACTAVEAALADFAPRPHWGKVFTMDAGTVRSRYQRMSDFEELRIRHDPQGKFGNAFLDDVLG